MHGWLESTLIGQQALLALTDSWGTAGTLAFQPTQPGGQMETTSHLTVVQHRHGRALAKGDAGHHPVLQAAGYLTGCVGWLAVHPDPTWPQLLKPQAYT